MKQFILVIILMSGLVPYASAVQLDTTILSEEDTIDPLFQFLRVIYIEYPNNGEISELLRGEKQIISLEIDSDTTNMDKILIQLNQNLKTISSNSIVTDVKINYRAMLQGNENNAVIEYKIQLIPTITNHILAKSFEKSTVDANWSGLSIDESVILQTTYGLFDINNPKTALDVMIPSVSKKLGDVSILEIPLIDSSGILDLPLHKWHSLFDNTAIIPGVVEYKYSGKNVITHYSMGECTLINGFYNDREWVQEINLDKNYTVRIIESRDDATVSIEGYVDTTSINGNEVFLTSLKSLVTQKPATDEFPVTIMYGMAGMAAIGAVVMFVMSDRKLKKDKNEGQTGIHPAHLVSYETSSSAGSYKTNRGESYLELNGASKMPL